LGMSQACLSEFQK